MKLMILAFMLVFSTVSEAYLAEYPEIPLMELTPGSLCDRPDSYRYAEKIPYCNRDVDTSLKADVFREYRHEGYRLNPKKRSDYKIDHLIPLCAGGSNRENNLWPQHVTVYTQTDPLEHVGCEKLKAGKIKQAKLIELILTAKRNLSLVPEALTYLEEL